MVSGSSYVKALDYKVVILLLEVVGLLSYGDILPLRILRVVVNSVNGALVVLDYLLPSGVLHNLLAGEPSGPRRLPLIQLAPLYGAVLADVSRLKTLELLISINHAELRADNLLSL